MMSCLQEHLAVLDSLSCRFVYVEAEIKFFLKFHRKIQVQNPFFYQLKICHQFYQFCSISLILFEWHFETSINEHLTYRV